MESMILLLTQRASNLRRKWWVILSIVLESRKNVFDWKVFHKNSTKFIFSIYQNDLCLFWIELFSTSPFPNSYKEIKQWSYNFPNYFYINSTKDIMWKRHYTLSEIHIFTCSFQCMKQSLTIYSIVEIGQSFLFISNS